MMTENFVGKYVTLAGWGLLAKLPIIKTSPTLQKVNMLVVELSECREVFIPEMNISESHLCVSGIKREKLIKSACNGDSGGPLMYPMPMDDKSSYVQIGIASYVVNEKSCNLDITTQTVNVYTKVSSYLLWILDNMSE